MLEMSVRLEKTGISKCGVGLVELNLGAQKGSERRRNRADPCTTKRSPGGRGRSTSCMNAQRICSSLKHELKVRGRMIDSRSRIDAICRKFRPVFVLCARNPGKKRCVSLHRLDMSLDPIWVVWQLAVFIRPRPGIQLGSSWSRLPLARRL